MGDDTGNMGDSGGQAPATTGNGRRLTYAELATRLGISGEAARILVRRRGWQRIMPNHPRGLTVVVVPDDALADEDWRRLAPTAPDARATEGDTEGGQAVQPATGEHLMAGALAALETAVLSLTERAVSAEAALTEASRRADSAFSLAEGTLAQLADATARGRSGRGPRRCYPDRPGCRARRGQGGTGARRGSGAGERRAEGEGAAGAAPGGGTGRVMDWCVPANNQPRATS